MSVELINTDMAEALVAGALQNTTAGAPAAGAPAAGAPAAGAPAAGAPAADAPAADAPAADAPAADAPAAVAENASTEVAPPLDGPIVALNSTTASAEDIKSSMLYRLECVLHAFEHVSVTAARDLVHAIHADLTAL